MKKPRHYSLWILTTEYEPYIVGGLGTVATSLTQQLVKKGVRTIVLSKNRYAFYNISNVNHVRIIRIPESILKNDSPSKIHRWIIKRGHHNPDCIHIHSLLFTDLARYLRKYYKVPVIYTCHSLVALEKGPKNNMMINRQVQLLKIADRIVVPSRWELAKIKQLYPFCKNKQIVIKHGVHMPRASKIRVPRTHLLYVGRLIPSKGIESLLKAIAILKKTNKRVKLHVIGKGNEQYEQRLKQLVKRLGIDSNVEWLGFREQRQVLQMYSSYGAVVMPSITGESFGLVALEALASGVPLVATRAGGLSEIVNNRVAQVIPRTTSYAIASAIKKMWANPTLTNKRVIAGKKLASRYRWTHVADQYIKLVKQMKNNRVVSKGA